MITVNVKELSGLNQFDFFKTRGKFTGSALENGRSEDAKKLKQTQMWIRNTTVITMIDRTTRWLEATPLCHMLHKYRTVLYAV
jgi:hypothetical protein